MKIKEEPVDESTSRESRKRSSDHRSSSSSRRRHDSNRSNSLDKSRERDRDRRDPRLRNRSPPPPRRRSPPPRKNAKEDFLEELRHKLGDKGQDTSFLDNFDPKARNRDNGFNRYGQPKFGHQQQNMMMMNNFPNMMPDMMQYQQYNQPMQFDMYGNPIMVPPLMNIDIPQPVPPPAMQEIPPGTIPHNYMSAEPIAAPIVYPQAQSMPQNNESNKKNNNAMNKVKKDLK